jgi:hypothetical protein
MSAQSAPTPINNTSPRRYLCVYCYVNLYQLRQLLDELLIFKFYIFIYEMSSLHNLENILWNLSM